LFKANFVLLVFFSIFIELLPKVKMQNDSAHGFGFLDHYHF